MAKKKSVKEEEDLDDDFGDFEDNEIESLYPKVEKKTSEFKEERKPTTPTSIEEEDVELEEEYEDLVEEEPALPEYQYLDVEIEKAVLENDFIVKIIGQSHGFCNTLVKHLLNMEGVNIATYKATGLEPPTIFIRLESGFKIKEILYKGIEAVRKEVAEIQKLFLKVV